MLIGTDDSLKIGDFGLSRTFTVNEKPFTNEVVTLKYRAPELLLGDRNYSIAVDIWSVGCIFFDLGFLNPLFDGKDSLEMIKLIFGKLGTPTEEEWPGMKDLPLIKSGLVIP